MSVESNPVLINAILGLFSSTAHAHIWLVNSTDVPKGLWINFSRIFFCVKNSFITFHIFNNFSTSRNFE